MRYRVEESYCPNKLTEQVNALLLEGWQPQGGVSTTQDDGDGWSTKGSTLYIQALVLA